MYFWRIEKLKAQMAARPLSERETLPYLITFSALSSIVLPQTNYNLWDGIATSWSVMLAVVGTVYIFRQNGGAGGKNFLQRYFAIGWVVGTRLLVTFAIISVVFYGMLIAINADIDIESTSWHGFLFVAVAETAFYWRVGSHVRDIAKRAKSA